MTKAEGKKAGGESKISGEITKILIEKMREGCASILLEN